MAAAALRAVVTRRVRSADRAHGRQLGPLPSVEHMVRPGAPNLGGHSGAVPADPAASWATGAVGPAARIGPAGVAGQDLRPAGTAHGGAAGGNHLAGTGAGPAGTDPARVAS